MLLLDVDVGDGALAADFLESVLDGGAVVWWVKGQGERLLSPGVWSQRRGGRDVLISSSSTAVYFALSESSNCLLDLQ